MVSEVIEGGIYWTCKCEVKDQGTGGPLPPYRIQVHKVVHGHGSFVGWRIDPKTGAVDKHLHCLVDNTMLFASEQSAKAHYDEVCQRHAADLLRQAMEYTHNPDVNAVLATFVARLDA